MFFDVFLKLLAIVIDVTINARDQTLLTVHL